MQYTEEHYAQMYNGLPEGLKDLVLSGRLAILVSGIGSRHGLTADQIADLEPAIEDVCLGLITKKELVENIRKSTDVDQRVANRIAAEADLEILRPFDAELAIARKQKEDLDQSIGKVEAQRAEEQIHPAGKKVPEPQNVSGHATAKKVSDWYNKESDAPVKSVPSTPSNFDWEKDFGKSKEEVAKAETVPDANIETKLEKLTESINMLVSNRFGAGDKDNPISTQMQELFKRLEKAEKENEENKKLIKNLSGIKPVDNIFGTTPEADPNSTKIQIDKQRKVEIARSEPKEKKEVSNGNIQITSVSKSVPIEHKGADLSELISSTVSKDTLDSIVETRNKPETIASTQSEGKKGLSLEELISGGDKKIKEAAPQKTATLVFPGRDEEKKIDIKNLSQKESLKQTLLEDLDFLKSAPVETKPTAPDPKLAISDALNNQTQASATPDVPKAQGQSTYPSNPFKDELMPTTKEDRMRALQAKIKSLNTGASVGGKSNIGASTLDPYRL
jgi:hypothetical protein